MSLSKTQAVVLRTRDLGETDRLVTLYTLEHGKVGAVSKGARKARSRLGPVIQTFNHLNLLLYKGKSLYTITGADLIDGFPLLRRDLAKMTAASYITELVERTSEEGDPDRDVFYLLVTSLHLLAEAGYERRVTWVFQLRLLDRLGLAPRLDGCQCGRRADMEGRRPVTYDPAAGGVLCPRCGRGPTLSRAALRALYELQTSPVEEALSLSVGPAAADDIDEFLHDYVVYHLGREPNSLRFLRELWGMRGTEMCENTKEGG